MKKDDVFELVKALTPNEKRYFKLFSRQHGEESTPKYLDLYEAMDQMHEFDLEKLGELLADKRILKFLNQEKKYLKEKLLDALRVFKGARSVDTLLHRLIEDHAILYEKGLFAQSQKQLSKAKKLAEQFDRFAILIDILSTERKLAIELSTHDLEKQVHSISEEQRAALDKLENVMRFQSLWMTLLAQFRKEGQGEKRAMPPVLGQVSTTELLSSLENGLSFSAKHLFYSCSGLAALISDAHEKASQHYEALILLWQARPDRIEEEPHQYMLVLSNFLNVQHKLESYTRFPEIIDAIRQIKIDSFSDEAEAFQNIIQLELLYFLNHGIPFGSERSLQQVEERLEAGLKKYADKINAARRLTVLHNMMLAKFFLEDWRGANHWRTKIEHDPDARKVRKEIGGFAKVMQLILQYELGDYEWILNLYRNHIRSLDRKDRLNEFYELLLRGINKLAQLASSASSKVTIEQIKTIFEQINAEISAIFKDKDESSIFGGSEARKWVNYKLSPHSRLRDFI